MLRRSRVMIHFAWIHLYACFYPDAPIRFLKLRTGLYTIHCNFNPGFDPFHLYSPAFYSFSRQHVWAKCPSGYFLNGLYISASKYLHQIEYARCCRPNNHPDNYADCYEKEVVISFDKKGWSVCQGDGYYMNGFYRGGCDYIYCIEKFSCCKMKTGDCNLYP